MGEKNNDLMNKVSQNKISNASKSDIPDLQERVLRSKNQSLNNQSNLYENEELQEQNDIAGEQDSIEDNEDLTNFEDENSTLDDGEVLEEEQTQYDEQKRKAIPKIEKQAVIKLFSNPKIWIFLGIVLAFIFFIMLVAIIADQVNGNTEDSPLNTSPEVLNYIEGNGDYQTLVEYLEYLGFCENGVDSDDPKNCDSDNFANFFKHFKNVYDEFSKFKDKNGDSIKLNIHLLLETISYNITDNELMEYADKVDDNKDLYKTNLVSISSDKKLYNELTALSEAMVEQVEEQVFYNHIVPTTGECRQTMDKLEYYRISNEKYVSFLKYGKVHENYSGNPKIIKTHGVDECEIPGQVIEEVVPPTEEDPTIDVSGIKTTSISVKVPGVNSSYKIAWVSDLHLISENDRNNSTTAMNRYNNDFFKTSKHSDEWLPIIIEYINRNNFDLVIFGGDMVDQGTKDNISLFKTYYDKVTVPKMYIRADHDKQVDLYGTKGDTTSITSENDVYTKTLGNVKIVGVNYTVANISENALSILNSEYSSASNVILATHVPFKSDYEPTKESLKNFSVGLNRSVPYYFWNSSSENNGRYHIEGNISDFLTNYVYNENTKTRYVLAGHMHASWKGQINNEGTFEQIFGPAYEGNVGVINITP